MACVHTNDRWFHFGSYLKQNSRSTPHQYCKFLYIFQNYWYKRTQNIYICASYISCHVMSCLFVSCQCHLMSRHIIPYHIISYHVVSYIMIIDIIGLFLDIHTLDGISLTGILYDRHLILSLHNDGNEINVQTMKCDLQKLLYHTICTHHWLHTCSDYGNKIPDFPYVYICIIIARIWWYDHLKHTTMDKIWKQWKRFILPIWRK